MSEDGKSCIRWARLGQRGQILPLVAVSLVVLLGFTGFVIDAGRVYVSYNELQASTNAAALAGAQALPSSSAAAVATSFSGVSGALNAKPNLPNVTMASGYPHIWCSSNTAFGLLGIACGAPAGANAIAVKQQVTVPLTFLRLVRTGSLTITATATAAAKGSTNGPFNVAILVDTTDSMTDTDRDSNCASTRLNCALAGVQTLLNELSPCSASVSSCGAITANASGGGGNVAKAVDKVSLFAFPAVSTTSAKADYNGGTLTTKAYATPFPATSTYQIVNFSSDYRSSDSATSLYGSSNLAEAVGTSKSTGKMQAKGGYGTYYAQAIYQAQAALAAAASASTQNVLIILSDGNATAKPADVPGASTTKSTYPSAFYQCQQAIAAAQAATAAGTWVYAVAYGAEASGCLSDNTACGGTLGTDGDCVPKGFATVPSITPCTTMQRMASDATRFFSDYTATGSSASCIAASRPTSSLNQIFTDIGGDLTLARLIPNGTP
jgi:hypothetical protein